MYSYAVLLSYLNALRNDRSGRGDLEGRLQEAHDAPDGDHDENGDNAVKHDLKTFRLALGRTSEEVFDEAPEERDDGEGDEEADETVQERVEKTERIEKRLGRSECRKRKKTKGKSDVRDNPCTHRIVIHVISVKYCNAPTLRQNLNAPKLPFCG